MSQKILKAAVSVFFEYDTQKIVHIRSKKVGVINRILQLAIIAYIVGYAIIWKKGYQEVDMVKSTVTSKVKGIIFSNDTDGKGIGKRTWDVADYVIPPQENNAFFVMTNVIVTPNQTQTYCGENPDVNGSNCTTDADCEKIEGRILEGGNGPIQGKCVNSELPGKEDQKVCQIYAWCPLELDDIPEHPVLAGSENFTVFIRNNIQFPHFNVRRINIFDKYWTDKTFKFCRWKKDDPKEKFCPIFFLRDIAEGAGVDYNSLTRLGGVMQILIDWTCNLDNDIDDCIPEYRFRDLDRGTFTISRGLNFRYSDKYVVNGVLTRTLYKSFGIRFLITVEGRAGKFSFVPLLINIASGLALLALATLISDFIVLYVLKSRDFYKQKKYLNVKGQDAFEILDESNSVEVNGSSNSAVKRATPSLDND